MRHSSTSYPVSEVLQRRRLRLGSRLVLTASGFLAAVLLAGCAGTPSPFLPASTNAQPIYDLFVIFFVVVGVVFVLVAGALVYAAVRFRSNDDTLPPQIEGSKRIEITLTSLVALGLIGLFLVSLQTLYKIAAPQPVMAGQVTDTSLRVRVIGHRWWWEFVYPTFNITTANELHVPMDVDLRLEVESVDVVHSFWVPQLAGKQDGIPGYINPLYLRVTQSGVYVGQCAEYCGLEHADMRLQVIADTPDQFQTWVQAQQAAVPVMSGLAADGEAFFMKSACIGCHAIRGTAAKGAAGPDLTKFGSRRLFAGAVLENTPETVAQWLANPGAMKPGVTMPKLPLTPDQISALTAYLEALK